MKREKYFLDTNVIVDYLDNKTDYVLFLEDSNFKFYYTSSVKAELIKFYEIIELESLEKNNILHFMEYPQDRRDKLDTLYKFFLRELHLTVPEKFRTDVDIFGEACYLYVTAWFDDENDQHIPGLLTNNMIFLKRIKRHHPKVADIISAVGLESAINVEDIKQFL
ncbi:hypothetical protein TI03_03835 [Achromatium sp. WMS1]|nr:hypothetical protein TI03_03835 [Achromatium sp. WMS1]